jgi:hypothetical protein
LVALAVSCGAGTKFPGDALSVLRAAARHSSTTAGATIAGTMSDESGPVVGITGLADFADRSLSMTMHSAIPSRPYPPYDVRLVDGWQYVMIDSAVVRPPGLRPDAEWIAYRTPPHVLPLPDRGMSPAYPFMVFERLTAGKVTDAQELSPGPNGDRRIEFRVPDQDPAVGRDTYIASIGPDDRIHELSSSLGAIEYGAVRQLQASDLVFDWTSRVEPVSAPEASSVQRLEPGEELYPSGRTTTTVPQPGAFSHDDYVAGNRALFDTDKTQIESSLRAQADPKLNAFAFDAASNEVRAGFAYAEPSTVSDSRRDAFAWSVAKTLSQSFWFPEIVSSIRAQGGDPSSLPGLRITLDRKLYRCQSSVQIAMADKGVALADWVRRCTP